MSELPEVPRDLAAQLDGLSTVAAGTAYDDLSGSVRGLPDQRDLPPCPACGDRLSPRSVFESTDGVAVALQLGCGGHDEQPRYVYEVTTQQLYAETARQRTDEAAPPGDTVVELTLTDLRAALQRAAEGESPDRIVAEQLTGRE